MNASGYKELSKKLQTSNKKKKKIKSNQIKSNQIKPQKYYTITKYGIRVADMFD